MKDNHMDVGVSGTGFFGTAVLFGLLSLALNGFILAVFCVIIYFFLAAAGVVPHADVIPVLPYV